MESRLHSLNSVRSPIVYHQMLDPNMYTSVAQSRYQNNHNLHPDVFDYNDPYQVNSMADVISKTFDPTENGHNPLGTFMKESWGLFKRGTVDPIRHGDMKALGLNALVNFSETMDVAAAPVKALLIGGSADDVKKAIGIGVKGRYNYDYNVNVGNKATNFVANMMLEIISDPINWVTLGLKAVVTSGAKAAVKATAKEVAQEVGAQFTEDTYKVFAKNLVHSYMGNDAVKFGKAVDDMAKWAADSGALKLTTVDVADNFYKSLKNVEKTAMRTMGARILQSTSKVVDVTEQAEKALLKTALSPTIFPPYFALKKLGSPIAEFAERQMHTVGKNYQRPDGAFSFANIDEYVPAITQNMKSFGMVLGELTGDTEVPEHVIRGIKNGVQRDQLMILNTFRNNITDADKAIANVNEYITKMTNGRCSDLKTYTELVQNANKKYSGEFDLEQKMYEELLEKQNAVADYTRQYKAAQVTKEVADELQNQLAMTNIFQKATDYTADMFHDFVEHSEDIFYNFMDKIDPKDYYNLLDMFQKETITNMDEWKQLAGRVAEHKQYLTQYKQVLSDKMYAIQKAMHEQTLPTSDLQKEYDNVRKTFEALSEDITQYDTPSINRILEIAKAQISKETTKRTKLVHAVHRALKKEKVYDEFLEYVHQASYTLYDSISTTRTNIEQLRQMYLKLPEEDPHHQLVPMLERVIGALSMDAQLGRALYERQVEGWLKRFVETGVYTPFIYNVEKDNFTNALKALQEYQSATKLIDADVLGDARTNYFAKLLDSETVIAEQNAIAQKLLESSKNVVGHQTIEHLQKIEVDTFNNVQKELQDMLGVIKIEPKAIKQNLDCNDLTYMDTDEFLDEFPGDAIKVENSEYGHGAMMGVNFVKRANGKAVYNMIQDNPTADKAYLDFSNAAFPTDSVSMTRRDQEIIQNFFTFKLTKDTLESSTGLDEYTSVYNDMVHLLQSRQQLAMITQKSRRGNLANDMMLEAHQYDDILEQLEEVNPVKYEKVYLESNAHTVLTQLQVEKLTTTLALSTNGKVGNILSQIKTRSGELGRIIETFENTTDAKSANMRAAIETLDYYAKTNYEYHTLLNELGIMDIPDKMRIAFMESLQNFSHADPRTLANNPGAFNRLIETVEDHLYSSFSKDKTSLDHYRMRMFDAEDKWGNEFFRNDKLTEQQQDYLYKYFITEGHKNPGSDVNMTELVIRQELPELTEQLENLGKPVYICDIETKGDNFNTDEIMQFSYKPFGGKIHDTVVLNQKHAPEYFDDTSVFPEPSILRARYGDLDSDDELRQLWKQDFADEAARDLRNRCDELTLLKRMLNNIPNDAVIVWHNGDKFDIPMILRRMELNGLDTKPFKKHIHVDSLAKLKEKQGGLVVNPTQYNKLRRAFEHYARNMCELGATRTIELNAREIANTLKLLASEFTNLHPEVKFMTGAQGEADALTKAAREFDEVLNTVYEENKSYKSVLVDNVTKASISDVPGEELKTILGLTDEELALLQNPIENRIPIALIERKYQKYLLGQKLGMTAEQIEDMFGEQLNQVRVLQGSGNMSSIAYKNIYDVDLCKSYFTFEPTAIPIKGQFSLNRMTQVARNVRRVVSKQIKNLKPLNQIDLTNYLQQLKNLSGEKFNNIFDYLDLNKVTTKASQFAMLREMWKMIGAPVLNDKLNLLGYADKLCSAEDTLRYAKELFPQLNPELLEMVVDPTETWTARVFGVNRTTDAYLKIETLNEQFKDTYKLMELRDEITGQFDNLDKLARGLDHGKNWTSASFAVGAVVQPLLRAFEKFIGLSEGERYAHIQAQRFVKNQMAAIEACELLGRANNEEGYLLNLLSREAPFLVLATKGFTAYPQYNDLLQELLTKEKQFAQQGIIVQRNFDFIYVGLHKNSKINIDSDLDKVVVNNIECPRIKHRELEIPKGKLDDTTHSALTYAREKTAVLSEGKSVGTIGGILKSHELKYLYEKLPETFRDKTIGLQKMYDMGILKGLPYNRIIQGPLQYRMDFTRKLDKELLLTGLETLRHTANRTEKTLLYTDMYFNKASGFSLDDTGIFKGLSDEEIFQALKNSEEMVVTYLVADNSKLGYHVRHIEINSIKDLEIAKARDAVVMPYQVFTSSFKNINSTTFDNRFLDTWQKLIYAYKVGYLIDPGVWIRNYMDSTLKTFFMTGDPLGTMSCQLQAMGFITKYDSVIRDITMMYPDKAITDSLITEYFQRFASRAKLTRKEFEFLHGFFVYGPSAGETKALQEYMKAQDISTVQRSAWGHFVSISGTAMKPNSNIEQVVRLAEYIQLTRKGLSKTDALVQVERTHFDYTVKSNLTRAIELIIPFYNFTRLNLEFWIKLIMEKPWVANILNETMIPVWDFDSYDHNEFANNQSLQYQILAGNLPLSDTGFTFKANPSYMDVYNLLVDPANSVVSKLAAPIQNAISGTIADGAYGYGIFASGEQGVTQFNNVSDAIFHNASTYPIIGAIAQRYGMTAQNSKERLPDGSMQQLIARLLPGTFGATQRWQSYNYAKAFKSNSYEPYTRSGLYAWNRFYKYPRRYIHYAHRFYAHMYYPDRARNPLERYYARNYYSKFYTKKGKRRWDMQNAPNNPKYLDSRIQSYQMKR